MADPVAKNVAAEMADYAGFSPAARLYIAMILDCVLERDAWRDRWRPRIRPHVADRALANIAVQRELRTRLHRFWACGEGDAEFTPLVMTSSWDLAMADLNGFAPYRFLYERVFGMQVRPLLPSTFAAAALLPHHPIALRMALLSSLTQEAIAACNQASAPAFFPDGDAFESGGEMRTAR